MVRALEFLPVRLVLYAGLGLAAAIVDAQLTDVTQTANVEDAGIKKSLEEQVGAGRGDADTPGSSLFLIQRDPLRAISRGRQLFQRKFTMAQGIGPRTGDGVGNIEADASHAAGLADSCTGCHGRPRGAAGFGGDVFTRPDSRDAPHLFGLGLQEMLADEITVELRDLRDDAIAEAARRNRRMEVHLIAKGIDYGVLSANTDGTVDTSAVEGVNADLRVRPFFAQGGTISIREFVVGALNAEMGLEAPDPDLLAGSQGGRVITPAGMVLDGALDAIEPPPVSSEAADSDGDGVSNEIPVALVDYLEFYLLNYFSPATGKQDRRTRSGQRLFAKVGCAECHVPDLPIEYDRRVANVETTFDPGKGIFNRLFAVASVQTEVENDDPGLPPIQRPAGRPFLVKGIYTDFKRHDLGPAFWERNFDGTITKEFMTEPLWGVGSTAPYGHDGRSINLEEVILRHGGEAEAARNLFVRLRASKKGKIIRLLRSLVLFGPPDTASNLNPGDPSDPMFPLYGHGSIDLSVLFNDPNDKE